jgi:hypothetical protein
MLGVPPCGFAVCLRLQEQRGRSRLGSGTGDTGDTFRNKLSRPRQLLRRAKSMLPAPGRTRGRASGPPPEPQRRPVCPRPRSARPNPATSAATLPRVPSVRPSPPENATPASPRPVAPRRARLADRASPSCAAFCAASPQTPRNPRQSAGGSNPSPPTVKNRTWLCLLATSGTTTLRLWGYEQSKRGVANRSGRVLRRFS